MGIGSDAAVRGDLVVLDPLGRGNQASIEGISCEIVVLDLFVAFFDQTFHTLALLSRWLFAKNIENSLQTLDMPFSLFEMFFEARPQLFRGCSLGHLGQSLRELVLGVIDVAKVADIKFFKLIFFHGSPPVSNMSI